MNLNFKRWFNLYVLVLGNFVFTDNLKQSFWFRNFLSFPFVFSVFISPFFFRIWLVHCNQHMLDVWNFTPTFVLQTIIHSFSRTVVQCIHSQVAECFKQNKKIIVIKYETTKCGCYFVIKHLEKKGSAHELLTLLFESASLKYYRIIC